MLCYGLSCCHGKQDLINRLFNSKTTEIHNQEKSRSYQGSFSLRKAAIESREIMVMVKDFWGLHVSIDVCFEGAGGMCKFYLDI